jgi:hypothetical protein
LSLATAGESCDSGGPPLTDGFEAGQVRAGPRKRSSAIDVKGFDMVILAQQQMDTVVTPKYYVSVKR